MKKTTRLAALAMSLAMTLGVMAGCGQQKLTPDQMIGEAQKKMAEIKNMDTTMQMDMEIEAEASGQSQKLEMNSSYDMTIFNDPTKAKMDMTVDLGDLGQQELQMYMEEENGKIYSYTNAGTGWVGEEIDASGMEQYDTQKSMDLYMKSAKSFKEEGLEKVGDVDAYKISGVISGSDLEEVVKSTGALDLAGNATGGMDLSGMFNDMGDLPVTFWVDQKTGYPVQVKMDMTSMMQSVMKNVMEAAGATMPEGFALNVSKMEVTMQMKNINAAADFTIPEEAKVMPLTNGGTAA